MLPLGNHCGRMEVELDMSQRQVVPHMVQLICRCLLQHLRPPKGLALPASSSAVMCVTQVPIVAKKIMSTFVLCDLAGIKGFPCFS